MADHSDKPSGIVIAPRQPLEALARMLILHLETELRVALGAAGVLGQAIELSPSLTKAAVTALKDAWRQGFETERRSDEPTNPRINIRRAVAKALDEK